MSLTFELVRQLPDDVELLAVPVTVEQDLDGGPLDATYPRFNRRAGIHSI